jgi:transcriptional regulator with XRE-family HTH domain
MSFLFDIGRRQQRVGRFIGQVRRELVKAFTEEQQERGLTRDELARELGVHKSVVTRRLNGSANLTLRVVAEMANALGRDIRFSLEKPVQQRNWYVPNQGTETNDAGADVVDIWAPPATRVSRPGTELGLPTAA